MRSPRAMNSPAMVVSGAVLGLLGMLFFFQGLGAVKGSFMTGSAFWAEAGPLIAVGGVALVARGARRGPQSDQP